MAERVARRGALGVAGRLALVEEVATRLADEADARGVLAAMDDALAHGLSSTSLIVNVVSEDGASLETLWSAGASARTSAHLREAVPLTEGTPAAVVLEKGEPLFWCSLEERNTAYPAYASFPSACASWAILPLTVHGETYGVASVGWSTPQGFGWDDRALLRVVAHQCAVALDRVRLGEIERRERETLELMSEGTQLMVSDLNPSHVVERLVELAVPRLAPWCAVYVASEEVLRRVAVEIAADATLADHLRGMDTVHVDSDTALARCYRTGDAEVVASITADDVRAVYPE
ncbi:MAG TPA: GAF domain-containing protein, partial [Acidimicrobiales bacterium]|nr:GAF domain-containing protein [Acidimicrobiales bacterium]